MPTLNVRNDIVFHYTDSGPVEHNDHYSTLVFIHGLSFHSGIFQRLLPVASSHSIRVICLNRREYQGSSPYTDEELRTINHGSDEERAKFLQEQGVLLALFINGIIQTLQLPKGGGLTIVGWSMGNIFGLALRACIGDLPADIQERLKSYTRSFILWDPPIQVFGFKLDESEPQISQEAFFATFPKTITTHFKHVDVDSKDPSQLDRIGDPSRKPTSETMTPEELSSTLDFTPSFKCDIPLLLPTFSLVISNQMEKALLDPQVREGWGGGGGEIPVWHICGDHNPAVIQTAPWLLEDKVKFATDIHFKLIGDANHFLMWEDPDRCLAFLKQCIPA